MRSIFLILRKSFIFWVTLAVLLSSWLRVDARAESKAIKAQATVTIIKVDGIITTLSGAITTVNANPATQYIVNIQGNITMNANALTISNPAGVTIVSDMSLSGVPFSLTKSASGRHFIVTGSLTLENIILDGGGNFGGVQVNSGGKFSVMDGAVIQKCYAASTGGGIYGNTGSAITVGGTAQIIGNTAGTSGGGIYANSSATTTSTVTINGGVISGNTATSSGGGLYGNAGSTIAVGGTAQISSNIAGTSGGGIFANSSAAAKTAVIITGGVISGNTASSNGGGIYSSISSTLAISGAAQINGNTAGVNGGGIFIINTKLDILGGTISNNRASSIGGGICSYHDFRGASSTIGVAYRSDITITGGSIAGNYAANGGGIGTFNVFDSAGSRNRAECFITITDSDISGNTASENGGGIYNYASSNYGGSKIATSNVSVTGGSITGNITGGNGGGIFSYSYGSGTNASCVVTVDGGVITGNSATDGGGIFGSTISNSLVNPDCRIIINSGNISDNKATGRGGGVCGDEYSKTTVTGGKIAANEASTGGGIYALNGSVVISGGAGINDNKASNNGGGVYVTNTGSVAISGGSTVTGNSAPNGDGGGIYTADTRYANLTTSNSTVFNGNSARAAYFFTGTHYASIQSASVSIPDTYVLNNFDVNYTGGTRIDLYTVTYDANGADETPPARETYQSGATVTVAGQNTLVMDGYAFVGWNTAASGSGALFKPGDTFTITRDETLYAQWMPIDVPVSPAYTVTYDANGGDGNFQASNLSYGEEYTVLPLSDTGITNSGHIFQGWNTAPDGEDISHPAGSNLTITENVILYAQWLMETVPAPTTFTVTYNANGGDGNYQDSNLIYGSEYSVLPLSDTGITNPGLSFQSWNVKPNGDGTRYQADSTFTVSDNLTLYAQWRVINSGNIAGEPRGSVSYGFNQTTDIEENEVPLVNAETTEIEGNHIPLTGVYSKFSFIGLGFLLVLSGFICLSRRRNR